MRSWGVHRTTGSTGAAVPESAADAGVGSGRAGTVSGMITVGGEEGRSKRLVVVGPEMSWLASIYEVVMGGARVDTGTWIAGEMASSCPRAGGAGSGTRWTCEAGEEDLEVSADAEGGIYTSCSETVPAKVTGTPRGLEVICEIGTNGEKPGRVGGAG